jgi:predicted nucleic acid-binding protein
MILVDLNVLLDVFQKRAPHFQPSAAVLDGIVTGKTAACIPAHAVTTIHYLMQKYATARSANQAVDWLLKHFQIAPVAREELARARALQWTDFEDAVVAAAAEALRCSVIITRNVSDFRDSPVPTRTPEEHLLTIRRKGPTAG